MRIECWINKATDTHWGCVILIALQRPQQLRELASIYIMHTYIYIMHTCIYIMHTCIYIMHTCIYIMHTCIYIMHTCIYIMHTYIYIMHTYIYIMHTYIAWLVNFRFPHFLFKAVWLGYALGSCGQRTKPWRRTNWAAEHSLSSSPVTGTHCFIHSDIPWCVYLLLFSIIKWGENVH